MNNLNDIQTITSKKADRENALSANIILTAKKGIRLITDLETFLHKGVFGSAIQGEFSLW